MDLENYYCRPDHRCQTAREICRMPIHHVAAARLSLAGSPPFLDLLSRQELEEAWQYQAHPGRMDLAADLLLVLLCAGAVVGLGFFCSAAQLVRLVLDAPVVRGV